jgi:hypothetical protein
MSGLSLTQVVADLASKMRLLWQTPKWLSRQRQLSKDRFQMPYL